MVSKGPVMTASRPPATHMLALVLSVVTISLLHYASSPHWLAVHELLKRAYYVPIVVAATLYGVRGGVATSILATVMYLPHVAMKEQGWPIEFGQYAEVVLFNTVAVVTGWLADRLHAERNRYQIAADELQKAYVALKAHSEERTRIDRWVTIGRLAAGAAHEIRNPLGGLLGALEILESEFPPLHPKAAFIDIAKKDVRRLENVVSTFLEFAHPAPPLSQRVEVGALLETATRLAAPSLAARGVAVSIEPAGGELFVRADVEQTERALVNVLLEAAGAMRPGTIRVAVSHPPSAVRMRIDVSSSLWSPERVHHFFEPFACGALNGGLALAVAKRLLENQGGAVSADLVSGDVRIVIDLPLADGPGLTVNSETRRALETGVTTEKISHEQRSMSMRHADRGQ